MLKAKNDAKGIGNSINILSKEGKIRPVIIKFDNGEEIECNSVWAATDYLKENGFYSDRERIGLTKPNYRIEYL